MKSGWHTISADELAAIMAAAVDEGRHSPVSLTICSGCGQWVVSIVYRIERRQYGPCCTPKPIITPNAPAAR